jgi:hypothetical protein
MSAAFSAGLAVPDGPGHQMLNELQDIRRLLTDPNPANISAAKAGLERLACALDELSRLAPCEPAAAPAAVHSLTSVRAELSAIATLSQNALDYFYRLGLLHAARFGAYERSGAFRTLDTASRMSVQL